MSISRAKGLKHASFVCDCPLFIGSHLILGRYPIQFGPFIAVIVVEHAKNGSRLRTVRRYVDLVLFQAPSSFHACLSLINSVVK